MKMRNEDGEKKMDRTEMKKSTLLEKRKRTSFGGLGGPICRPRTSAQTKLIWTGHSLVSE